MKITEKSRRTYFSPAWWSRYHPCQQHRGDLPQGRVRCERRLKFTVWPEGGDVTTHFRFGKKVYSSLIKYGAWIFSFANWKRFVISWVSPREDTDQQAKYFLRSEPRKYQYPSGVEKDV